MDIFSGYSVDGNTLHSSMCVPLSSPGMRCSSSYPEVPVLTSAFPAVSFQLSQPVRIQNFKRPSIRVTGSKSVSDASSYDAVSIKEPSASRRHSCLASTQYVPFFFHVRSLVASRIAVLILLFKGSSVNLCFSAFRIFSSPDRFGS